MNKNLFIVLLFIPALALAHHSGAIYDRSQTITVEGTVTRYAWANPHVYIHIEQVTDSGEVIGGFAPADRTVYMNVDTHDGAVPSLQGHSIGRWEGETLVIDTANFAPHRIGNGYRGTASGLEKRLIERMALLEGGTKLSYSFELTDPEFLAQTVTGSGEWAYRPDMEFIREPCELDNARESRSE